MSIYSNVTEEDMVNLRKLAEQQKNQRAHKIKNRILKRTHDIKLAGNLSPNTKKLDAINESTKLLGEIAKNSDVEHGKPQTPAIENKTGTQSLRDTLSFKKRSKNFFNLREKSNGGVFWKKIPINALREKTISVKDEEFDINPVIQAFFTDTNLTTKYMDIYLSIY